MWIEGGKRIGERKKEIRVGQIMKDPGSYLWRDALECTAINLTGNGPT